VLSIESLAPDLKSLLVQQPSCDADKIIVAPNAAVQQVLDAEQFADPRRGVFAVTKGERRRAAEYMQCPCCRQSMQYLLGHSIGEIARIGIGIQICERKYGHRILDALHNGIVLDLLGYLLEATGKNGDANERQGRQNQKVRAMEREVNFFTGRCRLGSYDPVARDIEYPAEYEGDREEQGGCNKEIPERRVGDAPRREEHRRDFDSDPCTDDVKACQPKNTPATKIVQQFHSCLCLEELQHLVY
jgi:hypothetical protein